MLARPARPSIFMPRMRTTLRVRTSVLGTLLALASACSSPEEAVPDDNNTSSSTGGGTSSSDGGAGNSGGNPSGTGGTVPTASGGAPAMTGGTSGGSGGNPATGPAHVVVVAHQDDDLLFINPDLKRAIDSEEPLITAYLTSGNAGEGMGYVTERELGIKSAYAFMAGVGNSWTCAPQDYAGKSVETCELSGADVKLVFFRLVDGFADGSFTGSLQSLWRGVVATSAAVDGSGLNFSRQELIKSLVALFAREGATDVYTTDFSFQHRENDHSDHENAGLFTVAASAQHTLPHALRSYITYSTKDYSPNLSPQDSAVVEDTFAHYASCDKFIDACSGGTSCDQVMCSTSSALYRSWFSRHYWFSRQTPSKSGSIQSAHFEGGCVVAAGTSASLGNCSGATTWNWGSDYTLRTPEGQCLSAPSGNSPRNASIGPCNQNDRQKWFIMDNGQIILGDEPLPGESQAQLAQCLDGGTSIGATIVVMDCSTDPALNWNF